MVVVAVVAPKRDGGAASLVPDMNPKRFRALGCFSLLPSLDELSRRPAERDSFLGGVLRTG